MPHERKRYLNPLLIKALTWSPSVCLLGMRQVGKTTLIKNLVKEYASFDDQQFLKLAESSEWAFVDNALSPMGLDECQKCPEVFDRVKLNADQRKKPGQYILTGSVRFLSKKQIKESLTGRTVILELLPFTLSESHNLPMSHFINNVIHSKTPETVLAKLKKESRFNLKEINHFGEVGGLPGICFRRDRKVRDQMTEFQLDTILSRDIEMIAPTKLGLQKIKNLLTAIMRKSGANVNQAELAREISTSKPTVKKLLDAFDDLFLIKKHGKTIFPVDLGVAQFLTNEFDLTKRKSVLNLLFNELHAQLKYQFSSQYKFEEYKSRGGIDIPFLIKIKNSPTVAIIADITEGVSDKSQIGLTWYKKKDPKSICIAIHRGKTGYISHSGHLCIPLEWVF